jgi:hypothetical protein
MNKFKTQRREVILGLNNDRQGATWQEERGPRYGNNRKGIAKDKVQRRRDDRLQAKRQAHEAIKDVQ